VSGAFRRVGDDRSGAERWLICPLFFPHDVAGRLAGLGKIVGAFPAEARGRRTAEGLFETECRSGGDWRFAGSDSRQGRLLDMQLRRRFRHPQADRLDVVPSDSLAWVVGIFTRGGREPGTDHAWSQVGDCRNMFAACARQWGGMSSPTCEAYGAPQHSEASVKLPARPPNPGDAPPRPGTASRRRCSGSFDSRGCHGRSCCSLILAPLLLGPSDLVRRYPETASMAHPRSARAGFVSVVGHGSRSAQVEQLSARRVASPKWRA